MKAIVKTVTINEYNNFELVDFAQDIDFTELFDYIKTSMGISCDFNQPEIYTHLDNVCIRFDSSDIANQAGAFSTILDTCYIASSSNRVQRDKETGEIRYWVSVDIQYEHMDGGLNGMNVSRASYSDKNGWIFKSVRQERGNTP